VTLLITVGNSLRSDDAVGPYLADHLMLRHPGYRLLHVGQQPESMLDDAPPLNPKKIIILDAAEFQGLPGEIRMLSPEEIPQNALGTHTLSLSTLALTLRQTLGAEVHFLGIQPVCFDWGETLSPAVQASADRLLNFFNHLV
jgi:hydrogenase 3 maturation protease